MYQLPQARRGLFHSEQHPPYAEGSIATLVCDPGTSSYDRTSILSRGRTGTLAWHPPSADCYLDLNTLPFPENGRYVPALPPPYPEDTMAVLECDPGHMTDSTLTYAVVRRDPITLELQWHPGLGSCFPYTDRLPDARHGRFSSSREGKYRRGDEAVLECDPGFTSDRIHAFLEYDGSQLYWNPASLTCRKEAREEEASTGDLFGWGVLALVGACVGWYVIARLQKR